jgi:DNA-binding transcriptional ArsR family regulator
MDVVLDLWLSAIYKDEQVLGSDVGPVVYFRNGTGSPLVSYTDLARRWGVSRSTVGRLLKKLADSGYLDLMSFPGRTGSVIYLKNYLSTMFQISDVLVDKESFERKSEGLCYLWAVQLAVKMIKYPQSGYF